MSDPLNKNQQDDLVAMLDSFVTGGGGHMNVNVDESTEAVKVVDTLGCSDNNINPTACRVPTLLDGMDEELQK